MCFAVLLAHGYIVLLYDAVNWLLDHAVRTVERSYSLQRRRPSRGVPGIALGCIDGDPGVLCSYDPNILLVVVSLCWPAVSLLGCPRLSPGIVAISIDGDSGILCSI